jgi:hypothetical protein
VIDLLLILGYLLAVRFTRLARMPAVAFLLTVLVSLSFLNQAVQHVLFILIYLCCALFSSTKIAYVMLASAVVNFLAVAYFLSNLYIDNYSYYFASSMIVVNLCILFTIIRSGRDGDYANSGDIVFTRLSNLFNVQTHTKTSQRR